MNIIDIPQSMLDMLAFRIEGEEPWGEPGAIEFDLAPVQVFMPTLLPEPLRPYVMDAAYRMQCPPDFVAASSVVMFGSIIGSACGVMPKAKDDWLEFPNLFGGAVGRPGTLKSPALSAGLAPMSYLDAQAQLNHADSMRSYLRSKVEREFELKLLKSDKGHIKAHLTEDAAMQRIVELTMNEEEPPKARRYRTNDATIEVIGELARHNPRGLMVFRDELIALLVSCDKQGHECDRAFYLESWNGRNSFAVDRIGRGSIVIPRLCLSLFGGIQPAKLQDYVHGTVAGYDNDGLLQRFQVLVFPDDVDDWEYVDETPDKAATKRVIEIAQVLANTDFVSLGAEREGEGGTPYFRFGESAQQLFIKWLSSLESQIRQIENPVIAEHLGKYRKLIPALALIFHLVDLADGKRARKPGISKVALQLAIDWGRYLETHAMRIYSIALDSVQPAVTALATKISLGKLHDGFSERDVYKAEWSHLKDAQIVHAACAELEMEGWIRRIRTEKGAGRPQSPSYSINPELKPK